MAQRIKWTNEVTPKWRNRTLPTLPDIPLLPPSSAPNITTNLATITMDQFFWNLCKWILWDISFHIYRCCWNKVIQLIFFLIFLCSRNFPNLFNNLNGFPEIVLAIYRYCYIYSYSCHWWTMMVYLLFHPLRLFIIFVPLYTD